MAPSKITHMLSKLYDMDKKLGGREHIGEKKKNFDEFSGLKEAIISSFFEIRKKIDGLEATMTKDGSRTPSTIKLEMEVKDKLSLCGKTLAKMNEYLKKNRQKDQALFEKRQKIYDSLHLQYNTFNKILFNKSAPSASSDPNEDINSFSDSGLETSSRQGRLLGNKRPGPAREMDDIEKQGMQEILDKDKQTDDLINQLNDGVLKLKDKAIRIGEQIDHTIEQCNLLEKEMTKTEDTLIATNDGLKKVLKAYRSPSKCCLDFILIIILVGLATTIYYQMK